MFDLVRYPYSDDPVIGKSQHIRERTLRGYSGIVMILGEEDQIRF